MNRRTTVALTFVILLFGCSQPAQQSLDEKLADKTPEEKQEILRLACLNEAEYTTRIKRAKFERQYGGRRLSSVHNTSETNRLKQLCREMMRLN
ncbi:MAG: hypothetical protein JSS27_02310 [Planctomycetes bacterium]|nr:hypothetical protein [Planctomycetota bacterium]